MNKKIERIKKKIQELGPVLPGSISTQKYVCKVKGCKCKSPSNPQKHGPYYQLSFTAVGKSSTMIIKKECLSEARKRIRNYQKLKTLYKELILSNIEFARKEGLEGEPQND